MYGCSHVSVRNKYKGDDKIVDEQTLFSIEQMKSSPAGMHYWQTMDRCSALLVWEVTVLLVTVKCTS